MKEFTRQHCGTEGDEIKAILLSVVSDKYVDAESVRFYVSYIFRAFLCEGNLLIYMGGKRQAQSAFRRTFSYLEIICAGYIRALQTCASFVDWKYFQSLDDAKQPCRIFMKGILVFYFRYVFQFDVSPILCLI